MFWNELLVITVSGTLANAFPGNTTTRSDCVVLTKINSSLFENSENNQTSDATTDATTSFGGGNHGQNNTQQKDVDHQRLPENAILIPEILQEIVQHLEPKDRRNAALVCKVWYHEVERLEKMRTTSDIVFIEPKFFNTRGEQRQLLKRYNEYSDDSKQPGWRPKLMIIFQENDRILRSSEPWSMREKEVMVKVINNSRIFGAGAHLPSAIQIDYDQTKALMRGYFFGYIFPEALLERRDVHVDIIFPSLELLRNNFNLAVDRPESNKKLFEELFQWKKNSPIKLAIVMSRKIPLDRNRDETYRRAKEMCCFLKSLPEGENMPICITLNYNNREYPNYKPRSDGPLAVILFGGEAVHAAAYFCDKTFQQESARKFENWMDTEQKCMSKATQTIGFRMVSGSYLVGYHHIRDVFGVNLMWREVNGHGNVFGLAKTQKYDEAQLDDSRRKNCVGIAVVGFE